MSDPTYVVNEIFYSLQGEGMRKGTANVFVRLTGCNLQCDVEPGEKSPGGFACDTEFESGRRLTLAEILSWINQADGGRNCNWLTLTGGEPGLQVDEVFCNFFHEAGYNLAIETNGSVDLRKKCPGQHFGTCLDWICVSPKVAEHAIKQKRADEVKYVRGYGQAIPKTAVNAPYQILSPAFDAKVLPKETLDWCIDLVKQNPKWRLSVQEHNTWAIR